MCLTYNLFFIKIIIVLRLNVSYLFIGNILEWRALLSQEYKKSRSMAQDKVKTYYIYCKNILNFLTFSSKNFDINTFASKYLLLKGK